MARTSTRPALSTLAMRAQLGAGTAVTALRAVTAVAAVAAVGVALLCGSRLSTAAPPVRATLTAGTAEVRCLADGSGYFRARLRGALNADLNWRNAGLECEGGMRPDGHGIRVSFAGPLQSAGAVHRLRFIFGIEAAGEGRSGRALPANVTLILEGERRIFSTRGDNQCTVDELHQQQLGQSAKQRDYRVAARGFCVGPAASLTGSERVLVSRFDFSGHIVLYGESSAAKPSGDLSRETTHLIRPPSCGAGTRGTGAPGADARGASARGTGCGAVDAAAARDAGPRAAG